jgi:hypothetical protein
VCDVDRPRLTIVVLYTFYSSRGHAAPPEPFASARSSRGGRPGVMDDGPTKHITVGRSARACATPGPSESPWLATRERSNRADHLVVLRACHVQGTSAPVWGRQEFLLLAVQFRETVLFWILPNFGETFAKFALISH